MAAAYLCTIEIKQKSNLKKYRYENFKNETNDDRNGNDECGNDRFGR